VHAHGDGSLGAQLFAALDWVHALMGEPESIDASFGSPGHADGLHTLPGESLRGLSGDLTANLRYSAGRTACIAVSDQAGRFNRVATLLGKGGRLRAFDDGFEWLGPTGEKVDEQRQSKRGSSTDHGHNAWSTPSVACWTRRGRRRPPPISTASWPWPRPASSAHRTGQGESPETIKRMTQSAVM
jgi:predicted dehydrogenase